ncbi:MAG: cell envelope integrity protein TolA [Proteobacteria bacterium]|nr:cell envelope integrity protein TolA [Pseudomonadota bacterium]
MLERTSDRWVSITLSVLLHGTLVAALVYGFWTYHKSQPPAPTLAIEGTVVDSRTVNAPPVKTPPAPQPPAPTPAPEPPAPEPVEPTGPPEPTPEELAQREQALKDKAQQEQAQKDQAAKEQAQKEQAQKEQAEAQEKQRQLDEQKKQEAQRQADEKRKREAQEKADAERKAAEAKRLAEQKRAEEAQRAADEKARQESEADLRNSLAAEEHANQVRNSGALVSWVGQITARIQRAWLRPPSARQGIQCVLHITQGPGGQVLSAKIESCNGDQAVRESIEAAAYRASPLPPPPDPSLFERDLEVTFRPD